MKELELAPDGGLEVELDLRNRALRLIGEKMAECKPQYNFALHTTDAAYYGGKPEEVYRQIAFSYLLAMLEVGAIEQLDYDDLHKEISGW
jgi:hypothetical protein